ncbi:uncharacterized protein [Embiotoca jacksoni]|uniref:uncharacterized protein n=1 Tax=Embiotoca jacksoni TaxID=100190 RepID=UPI003703EC00
MASQLNRQAAALADTTALKDPAYASFLYDKLQRLQWPHRGRHATVDARCEVCGASFQRLRRLALRRALGVSREMTPRPASTAAPPPPPASEGSWVGDELPVKQQRRTMYEEQQQGGGAPWGWGGVQSTYLGGGGAKGLATVTPLPINAHHYLEGLWRVSCCRPELQHSTGLTSDGGHVTAKSSTLDVAVKPAAHSVATQTSRPPSAAAAFFTRWSTGREQAAALTRSELLVSEFLAVLWVEIQIHKDEI